MKYLCQYSYLSVNTQLLFLFHNKFVCVSHKWIVLKAISKMELNDKYFMFSLLISFNVILVCLNQLSSVTISEW